MSESSPGVPSPTSTHDRSEQPPGVASPRSSESSMPLDPETMALLNQMKQNTQTMNHEATRAFEYIREIDRHLEEAAPGVEVWSVLEKGKKFPTLAVRGKHFMIGIGVVHGNHRRYQALLIGHAKVGNKWGLAVAEGEVTIDSEDRISIREGSIGERRFLRDADRATKILAVPRIPELIKALSEELERVASEARATLDLNR